MPMRTTLIIDHLLEPARQLTGIQEKTALVRAGLHALIAQEAVKRLAAWRRGARVAPRSQTATRNCAVIVVDTSAWADY